MGAAWLWVRSEWRRALSGLLLLGLLIAVAGAVTMAAAAGARRADSAMKRFQVATNDSPVVVDLQSTDPDEMEALVPELPTPRELADRLTSVDGVDGVSVLEFIGAHPARVPDAEWFSAAVGAQRGRAPTSLVIQGRAFDVDDPHEAMVNEAAAAEWGSVGSELTLQTLDPTQLAMMADAEKGTPNGPTIGVQVVGVVRGIEEITDVPEPILYTTPAFVERYAGKVGMIPGGAQVAVGPRRVDEILPDLNKAAGKHFFAHLQDEDFVGRIDESISVEVTALWVFTIAAAIAGLIVVYQAISRGGSDLAAERSTRRALGFTPGLEAAASVLRLAPAIILGLVGSVASAVLLSGLFPRGIAKRAEPAPGRLADRPVLAIGAAVILLAGVAIAVVSGWEASRADTDRPARSGGWIRRTAALGSPAGFGLRLGFSSSRRARALRAGVVGVAIAVAGLLAVTAVEHSADRLNSTPRLFGAGWDAILPLDPGEHPQEYVERLRTDPDVAGVGWQNATGEEQLDAVGPGGEGPVEPQAFITASGSITPTLVEGRLPIGPNEVAIGDAVGQQLGAATGDTISVSGYRSEEVPFVVVGRVVNAGTNDLGNGFDVTEEGLRAITSGCKKLSCQIITIGIGVDFRPGVDVATAIARLGEIDERVEATPIPSVVYNLRQIGATPWYLAAFLVVLGFSGLGHALMTGWRLNRHDIAITRALGQTPRQAASTVRWQALLVGAAGAVVGLAAGLIAGRLVWRRVAEGAGALVETVVPPWVWVAAPALAVVLTVGLMIVPAARMGGLRLSELLRTE
jgi:hypothetical protein